MDTHIAEPTLGDHRAFQARLPGEPDSSSAAEPLRAEARPASGSAKGTRKSGLLSGVAIIAVVVIAGGGFLVSPFNTVIPVPPTFHLFQKQQNSVARSSVVAMNKKVAPPASGHSAPSPAHTAASPVPAAQPSNHSDVLAPAATLAGVTAPPPPSPIKQNTYTPGTPQAEVAELEGFGVGKPAAPQPQAKPAIVKAPVASAAPANETPPGYVPHEPGAPAVAPPVAHPAAHPAVTAAVAAPPVSAASVAPQVKTEAASSHPEPAPAVASSHIVVTPENALLAAQKLQAAPLSPPDQVQVLELVTQLATLVRDERVQIANLQADQQSGNKAAAAKLGDFERRLALLEANSALTSASDVQPAPPAIPAPSATSVALTSARAALASARQPIAAPTPIAQAPSAAPAQPVTPEIYHVQAASPGLAMLAEVDHSGGEGAQIQVQVGDTIPGYGHVLSVSQRGNNWVVKTDNGLIQ
jgi:hypothetical protein